MRAVLLSAVLLILASCDRAPADSPPARPPAFSAARVAVLSQLRDPESARFGPMSAGKPGVVCGTVNAHNGFGGYTGARAFAWSPGRLLLYEDPPDWADKGSSAADFREMGCSIGRDQAKALKVRALLGEMNTPEK